MHPILLKIGSITLYTYGFFVALGFFTAIIMSRIFAKKNNIDPQTMTDLIFTILISALIGARLMYVIINFAYYRNDLISVFKLWDGGLVFYGGFIASVIGSYIFIRIKKLNLLKTADMIAPGIALGHAVGRVGCFFAGCCYGKTCSKPWAVTFSNSDSLAPLGVHLHPTQLYSVFSNLSIFLILLLIYKMKKFHGQVFFSYLLIYSIFRSYIETFRGDFRGDFFGFPISVSQGISLVIGIISIYMLFYLYKKNNDSN
ncbi:MAG: prolipoprotein diacylglyceryl transferase [Desulfobacteraceae bacterium]|nr:prolipoprotein diacylglyceryl transferase [Desulfobacteraceae bacterium]